MSDLAQCDPVTPEELVLWLEHQHPVPGLMRTLCIGNPATGPGAASAEFGQALARWPDRFRPVVQLDHGAWSSFTGPLGPGRQVRPPHPGAQLAPGLTFGLVVWAGVEVETAGARRLHLLRRLLAPNGLLIATPGTAVPVGTGPPGVPEAGADTLAGAGLELRDVVRAPGRGQALVLTRGPGPDGPPAG